MKKLLLFAAVLLVATSCEEGKCCPKGDNLYMFSQVFEVQEQLWNFDIDEQFKREFSCTCPMPKLTREICEAGNVSATLYMEDGTQSHLPKDWYLDIGDCNQAYIIDMRRAR